MAENDHDTLIEVKTIVKRIDDWTVKHTADDAKAQGEFQRTAEAAHKRIDGLFVSGILALIFLAIGMVLNYVKR